jgi:4-hydroxybenzoate polyprenyltransferase
MVGLVFYFYYQNQSAMIMQEIDTIIFVSVTIAFAHAGSQSLNMAEDAEIDKNTPHKQDRPIPAGVMTEEEARSIAWILMLMAVGRAYITGTMFGIFVSLLIFFGVFYNLDPIRAKERIISIPWQAASRGLLLFPTIWAVYDDPFQSTPWVLGLFMFFYVAGFQSSADIIDRETDEEYGIKTFAVVFGTEAVAYIALVCTFLMIGVIIIAINAGILPEYLWTMNAIAVPGLIMAYYMHQHPQSISERTGNHKAWSYYYVGMVLTVVIPLLT